MTHHDAGARGAMDGAGGDAQPLAGVTVVELGTSLAAPFAGLVLAQLGAEVVKVETPRGGDPARRWGPPVGEGSSIIFQAANRDKKSVTVDLSDPGERSRLRRFVAERADVFLQNMRPGVVADFELDAATLLAEKPGLIYCNMGAYGANGPLSHLPGYDPLMQAFSGICHVTGPEDGEPCRAGVPMIDMGTGMWAVIGIQAALLRRQRTGKGGVVDVSLFETAMGWMSVHLSTVMRTGKVPRRRGTRGPGGIIPNQGFEASDGIIMITAGTDVQFGRLARALQRPQWEQDERYGTARARLANASALSADIAAVIATRPRLEWMEVLNRANVPNAPVHTPLETLDHPQTRESGLVQEALDGSGSQIALPLSLDGARLPYRRQAPTLGRDDEVLRTPRDD